MSRQHILAVRNFEKRPDQKKYPNIQRKKHKHKHQIRPRTPHKKQEYHNPPENEIEPDGNIVCWRSGPLRSIPRRRVS